MSTRPSNGTEFAKLFTKMFLLTTTIEDLVIRKNDVLCTHFLFILWLRISFRNEMAQLSTVRKTFSFSNNR